MVATSLFEFDLLLNAFPIEFSGEHQSSCWLIFSNARMETQQY
jgi:hypothetical protein